MRINELKLKTNLCFHLRCQSIPSNKWQLDKAILNYQFTLIDIYLQMIKINLLISILQIEKSKL